MITALCGGVGGSKLALGLYRTLPPDELAVIVNTADDLDFCGLRVCPDLDTVVYTLAGIAGRELGWGVEGDAFTALEMLTRYGIEPWFQVGDRDLATDIFRTHRLRQGSTLTAVSEAIATSLGVTARVLPMTDLQVATRLLAGNEWLDFQEYFVHRHHRDRIEAVRYEGIEETETTAEVHDAASGSEVIILVNSNPVLSILPILATPGINEAIVQASAPAVAVSPIIGTGAVNGPAADLMRLIDQPASALGVANAYLGIIDGIVIDRQDAEQVASIEALGVAVYCTDTMMRTLVDRERLATEIVSFARSLR